MASLWHSDILAGQCTIVDAAFMDRATIVGIAKDPLHNLHIWTCDVDTGRLEVLCTRKPNQGVSLHAPALPGFILWTELNTSTYPLVSEYVIAREDKSLCLLNDVFGDYLHEGFFSSGGKSSTVVAVLPSINCLLVEQGEGSSRGIASWRPLGDARSTYMLYELGTWRVLGSMDKPLLDTLIDRKISPVLNKENPFILAQEKDIANNTKRLVAFSLCPFQRLAEALFPPRVLSISAATKENEAIVACVRNSEVHLARAKYVDDGNVKELSIDFFDVLETEQSNITHAGWCQGATIWSSCEPEVLCLAEKGPEEGAVAPVHRWKDFSAFNIDSRYSSIVAFSTKGAVLVLYMKEGRIAQSISYSLTWENGAFISKREQDRFSEIGRK